MTNSLTDSKICSGCGVNKPLSAYYTKGFRRDSKCKECTLAEKKRRRLPPQQQSSESQPSETPTLSDGSRIYKLNDGRTITLTKGEFDQLVERFRMLEQWARYLAC